ncbi:transcriptional regulator, GntR family [Microbispora rosea]|uniref:Transcriptional regulator, GntR family n=1 Tax=Microbispora rosea TaxID=58117 RepID=A0A1N7B0V1_9ACTN|nr:FCD domain-containing protein [Microbispora rosea]GIH50928.1 GntR family transcriptional regulator [Microbispora rosea subsp. rosea]SIR44878.1 transcriptional regulator, GntR family [Microbispora rosea]
MTTGERRRTDARPRAFEEVLARIEERIAADGLTVGDRLPGERQLAEQLGVGRSSVREALRVLETLGVVASQAGRGPDAGAVLTSRPGDALTDLLRLHLGLATLSMREVIDTRLMIEQWAAARAAAAPARTATARMAEAIAAMDAARDPAEFVEHDIAFHLALAEAAGNRLIVAVVRALRDALRRYAVDAVVRLGDTGGLQDDHRRIHRAIEDGDAGAAAAAVAEHLARAYPESGPDS